MHSEELKIEMTDELGFIVRSFRTWAFIALAFMAGLFIRHIPVIALFFMFSLLFLIGLFFDVTHERFFIKSIEIKRGHVTIEYSDRNTQKKIEGELSEFKARSTYDLFGPYKLTNYLRIEHKGITIKQYWKNGWDYQKMQKVIDYINVTSTKKI